MQLPRSILAAALLLVAPTALAVPATGTFEAVRSCEAYKSFRKGTNPGHVRLTAGETYTIEEINEPGGDWVRVLVPGVTDAQRWVPKECGLVELQAGPEPAGPRPGGGQSLCTTANAHDSNVLALTWQPGFCEHYRYNGTKPECDALESGDLVISHLTLHGLWPNRDACGTRYGNCAGPELELSEETISEVAPWMPNLIYETTFARYEWRKHGVCQAKGDDEYFLAARALTEHVDRSVIGQYITTRIGARMSVNDFFAAVKKDLGPDVEQRVQLVCTKGKFLQEIRVNLPKDVVVNPDIRKVTAGAPKASARTTGCSGDEVYIEGSGRL